MRTEAGDERIGHRHHRRLVGVDAERVGELLEAQVADLASIGSRPRSAAAHSALFSRWYVETCSGSTSMPTTARAACEGVLLGRVEIEERVVEVEEECGVAHRFIHRPTAAR